MRKCYDKKALEESAARTDEFALPGNNDEATPARWFMASGVIGPDAADHDGAKAVHLDVQIVAY